MGRRFVIAAAIMLVAIWATGATAILGMPVTSDIAPAADEEPELVELPTGQHLWPYYSAQTGTFEKRSAINVVVHGSLDEVVAVLVSDADWNELDPEEEGDAGSDAFSVAELDDGDPENPIGWGRAAGAHRYAYMEIDDEPVWLGESEQLADGEYYGARHHLRLYEAPGGPEAVVVIQAHYEHFDWFTLRHSVSSLSKAQLHVESDLMDRLGHERVWRQHLNNTEVYDSDGWVTFVELLIIPLFFLAGSVHTVRDRVGRFREVPLVAETYERITGDHVLLFASMLAIVLGVRFGGIGLERVDVMRTKWIAAVFFPFIALGIPMTAYLLAGHLERRIDAAIAASVGLSTAFLLDYYYLGITVLPIEVILHRTGLVIAIGLIAAGGAVRAIEGGRGNEFIVAGIGMWILLLTISLSGML